MTVFDRVRDVVAHDLHPVRPVLSPSLSAKPSPVTEFPEQAGELAERQVRTLVVTKQRHADK